MAEHEHTPGPWTWEWEDKDIFALYGPKGGEDFVLWVRICETCAERKTRCTAPSEANARLIASAPDMLEALQEIVANAERHPSAPLREAASPAALRAIAKATGQEATDGQ